MTRCERSALGLLVFVEGVVAGGAARPPRCERGLPNKRLL